MERYKIFTSLSTVSNNEITIESDEEMATACWRFYSNMHIIKYALVFFWLRSSCKETSAYYKCHRKFGFTLKMRTIQF